MGIWYMTHFLKLFLVISPNGEDFDGDEYVFLRPMKVYTKKPKHNWINLEDIDDCVSDVFSLHYKIMCIYIYIQIVLTKKL